jgi:hypothetical protein
MFSLRSLQHGFCLRLCARAAGLLISAKNAGEERVEAGFSLFGIISINK